MKDIARRFQGCSGIKLGEGSLKITINTILA